MLLAMSRAYDVNCTLMYSLHQKSGHRNYNLENNNIINNYLVYLLQTKVDRPIRLWWRELFD